MNRQTFRGRITLWSIAVVTAALTLFAAVAAWNLRQELVENLDRQISEQADSFAAELEEQPPNRSSISFPREDLPRFPYLEIRDSAQRLLYRSPALGDTDLFPVSLSPKPFERTVNGQRIRFALFRRDGLTFLLGRELRSVQEAIEGLLRAYLISLPVVILVVGGSGWLIAQQAVAPIQRITTQAEQISASDLHQRMPDPATDEIGHLIRVLNAMLDRLQRSFEQVTRFTSDASHELKTPLALMRAEVESALESLPLVPASRELLENLGEQCSRLTQIVDGLLLLSRADDRRLALERTNFDLVRLVRELMEDAEILAEPTRLTLDSELDAEITVWADRRLLARAIMNLIDNAIKHNETGGRVTVAASAEGNQAVLRIGNTGHGLPREVGEEIFERFYRGDLSHSDQTPGHGLGLSIAREIARAHGGNIVLVDSNPEWTEFCLVLPLASDALALGRT